MFDCGECLVKVCKLMDDINRIVNLSPLCWHFKAKSNAVDTAIN